MGSIALLTTGSNPKQFIDKWNGSTPLYGNTPITFMKSVE